MTDAERDSISVYLRSAWGFDPPKPDFAWPASATGNGKPALRFDGASVRLQTILVPSSPQMTLFAVCEMDTPAQWGSLFN